MSLFEPASSILTRPDTANVKAAFGGFPSGVAAICAWIDDVPQGFVVSSFASGVSLDPPLVLFSVMNSSTTWPRLRTSSQLGVSVLAADQDRVVRSFSSRSGDRFEGVAIHRTAGGAIFIAGSPVKLECRIDSETPAGDHSIVVLRIDRLAVNLDTEPAVYHSARFRRLAS